MNSSMKDEKTLLNSSIRIKMNKTRKGETPCHAPVKKNSNINKPATIHGDNLPRHIICLGKKSYRFGYIIRPTNAFQAGTIQDF